MKPRWFFGEKNGGTDEHFQFLWGWNLTTSTTTTTTTATNFQFLWGWNDRSWLTRQMKELSSIYFQFLWGWNTVRTCGSHPGEDKLSIPLRMKRTIRRRCGNQPNFFLSIPLRMKHDLINHVGDSMPKFDFQFLWGWNQCSYHGNYTKWPPLSIPLRMKHRITPPRGLTWLANFQFLWGWNPRKFKTWRRPLKLSIPLRTKPVDLEGWVIQGHPHFQFLWGWNKT